MPPASYDFDVYVSYNQKDAEAVLYIAERLRAAAVKVWHFDWVVKPGAEFKKEMIDGIARSASGAVFFGSHGLGNIQSEEVLVHMQRRADAQGDFPIIPVLLPGADPDGLPDILKKNLWVDFKDGLDDKKALDTLIRRIKSLMPDGGGGTTGALKLKDLMARPAFKRLAKKEQDALALAGSMALAGGHAVDSILFLAGLLYVFNSYIEHVGYYFVEALRAQRLEGRGELPPAEETSIVSLLNLGGFDIHTHGEPESTPDFGAADAREDLARLVEAAGQLATSIEEDNRIRMRHILGAILGWPTDGSPPAVYRYLETLGYDLNRLRAAFLRYISERQGGFLAEWQKLISVPPADAPKPPDNDGDKPQTEPPFEPGRESVRRAGVSDQPTAVDSLGFGPYVKAIAAFLADDSTRPPLTLSIEGEWGSGKSSFMIQLRAELDALAEERRRKVEREYLEASRAPHPADWSPRPALRLRARASRLRGAAARRWREFTRRYLKGLSDSPPPGYWSPPSPPRLMREWLKRRRLRRLTREVRCLSVEFNPWRHDKEDALWASFALEFVRKLSEGMPPARRALAHFKLLRRRFKWRDGWLVAVRMVFFVIIIASLTAALVSLLAAQGLPKWLELMGGQDKDAALFGVVQASGAAGYVAVILYFLSKFREFAGNPFAFDIRKYVEAPDYEGRVAFIEQFHEDFRKIVQTYAGDTNKVYVFIDDLDRCDVPKAADLMQAINLMVSAEESQLVFIIGMDREKVAAGLAVKNEKLLPYLMPRRPAPAAQPDNAAAPAAAAAQASANTAFGIEYGYNFIEKFIQLPFSVPQPRGLDVKDLLNYIAPLAKLTGGDGGAQERERDEASKPDTGRGPGATVGETARQLTVEAVRGDSAEGEDASEDEELMRRAEGILAKASPVERPGVAQQKAEDEGAKKGGAGEAKRGGVFTLQDLGESVGVHNIVLMAAPALDYNPRRIKQFVNLFRLKAFVAYETGLLDSARPLTLEQLGKFVAIVVRWPRFLAELDEERALLGEMQRLVTDKNYKSSSQKAQEWLLRPEMRRLLEFGCDPKEKDPFDESKDSNVRRYTLADVDVDKLLSVSPRAPRPAPEAPPEQNAPPANTTQSDATQSNGSKSNGSGSGAAGSPGESHAHDAREREPESKGKDEETKPSDAEAPETKPSKTQAP